MRKPRLLILPQRPTEAEESNRRLLRLGRRLAQPINGPRVEPFGTGAVPVQDALIPFWVKIRDRCGNLVDLEPNRVQQIFARRRTERNIILKARQMGMTTYIAARFFLATILRPGTVTLQVAHSLESAQQIFRIVHRFVAHLPPHVGRALETARANVRELAFAGLDSRYIVDTAGNRNAGRGLTVHNLHASEVALWPGDAQETMAALMASVPPGGTVEIESTPHGIGGYFHTEWLRNTSGRNGETFTPHFFPWWHEAAYRQALGPGETLEPLSEEERRLVEREGLGLEQIRYRRHLRATFGELAPQEFAESALECFLVSGQPVFDGAAIDARLRHVPSPARVANNGAEQAWFEPQPGRHYVIGADVAEGGAAGDFSAAVVVDVETGLQCAELLARWPLHRFADELVQLGQRYNDALLAVERNNQGHAVLYALAHLHAYPRIYRHIESGGVAKPGWPMNAQTKTQAIGVLAKILREAPGVCASVRLLEQCRSFAYGKDGEMSAPPGEHDDLVIAMAIALAVRAQAGSPQLIAARFETRFGPHVSTDEH